MNPAALQKKTKNTDEGYIFNLPASNTLDVFHLSHKQKPSPGILQLQL